MPWKISDGEQARRRFVQERLARKSGVSMTELCRRHGISRECAHKWWRRFCAGGWVQLADRTHRSVAADKLRTVWWPRVLAALRACREFGPKKLRWKLRQDHPRVRLPSVRTLARWLRQAGQVRRQKRRARPGPARPQPGRLRGRCVNDVWTVDLKGSFRTADGRRTHPLTVRDLASRFPLAVRHVASAREGPIGAVLQALFRRHGLPKALRMDNGNPFGGGGPRGWTKLTAGWVKLGIRIEYGRPRCPQDNAEHEQMHRVLKEQTARPPSANIQAQQKRSDRWRQRYAERRPHESLGQRTPASVYRASTRRLPEKPPQWTYPPNWSLLRPDRKGRVRWRQRARLIGRAFSEELLGARPLNADTLAVYFGPHLLGTLHAHDRAGLRPVQWRKLKP